MPHKYWKILQRQTHRQTNNNNHNTITSDLFWHLVSKFLPFLYKYLVIILYRKRGEVTTANTFCFPFLYYDTCSLSSIEREEVITASTDMSLKTHRQQLVKKIIALNCFLPFGPWMVVKNFMQVEVDAKINVCKPNLVVMASPVLEILLL